MVIYISSFKIKQDRQGTLDETLKCVCVNCFRGKAIRITHSACVSVALVIDYAQRMRLIMIICSLSGSIFFFTLSHKRHDFRKKCF